MTLNCSADGNPRPDISWTRVSDNSAVVFPLTDIGLQHEGTYRCTANNSVGNVTRDVSIVVHCEYFAGRCLSVLNYLFFQKQSYG